jgi:hypothetical protein
MLDTRVICMWQPYTCNALGNVAKITILYIYTVVVYENELNFTAQCGPTEAANIVL